MKNGLSLVKFAPNIQKRRKNLLPGSRQLKTTGILKRGGAMWPETQRCLGTALRKTLMILTPLVNFINNLHERFSYESAFFLAEILSPKPKRN